ncbi:hypothetical protein Tco_0238811, partial [Tanacetum coccineum]
MDMFAFIHTPDPTKVKIVKQERNEDEPLLQATTIGYNVPMLPVAPDRAESKLEASIDKIFDEGGSDRASHPPKKLREDHRTPGGTSVGGKSCSVIKRLLAGAMLNAEVEVAAIPTLYFVTAFVSSMPKREARDHTDSMAEPNLCTIGSLQ